MHFWSIWCIWWELHHVCFACSQDTLTLSRDNHFTALKLCNCWKEWTAPSLCPEAGPRLSWASHHSDKKRKGQGAVTNSADDPGQQCEETGLRGEGRWTRILSDKTHRSLLISEGLILGYGCHAEWTRRMTQQAQTSKPWRSSGDRAYLHRKDLRLTNIQVCSCFCVIIAFSHVAFLSFKKQTITKKCIVRYGKVNDQPIIVHNNIKTCFMKVSPMEDTIRK